MECIPAGRYNGGYRGGCIAYYGIDMEKNGEQGAGQDFWENNRRGVDWDCRGVAFRRWYVPDNGVEQYGYGYRDWNNRNSCSYLPDTLYQRIKVNIIPDVDFYNILFTLWTQNRNKT